MAAIVGLVFSVLSPGPSACAASEPSDEAAPPNPSNPPDEGPGPASSTPGTPPTTPPPLPKAEPSLTATPPAPTSETSPDEVTPADAAVRSQGPLTVGYKTSGLKDLDQQPPATVSPNGHGDVWFTTTGPEGNTLLGEDGTLLARWSDATHLPSYAECQAHAQTGVGQLSLYPRDVLCVKTSLGRTALLVVTVLREPAVQGNLPTFDVTVWEPVTR